MDRYERASAVGGLLLALIVAGVVLWPRPEPSLEIPTPPEDPVLAAGLGWPVPHDCGDPEAWQALPGIGPTRAADLAEAAAAGRLRAPADLLRVPGIGSKLAARLEPRIAWPPDPEDERP